MSQIVAVFEFKTLTGVKVLNSILLEEVQHIYAAREAYLKEAADKDLEYVSTALMGLQEWKENHEKAGR